MKYTQTNNHPVFRYLNENEIVEIEQICKRVQYNPKDIIIHTNDRNRDILSIESGSVSIQIELTDGTTKEVAQSHDGAIVGEMNFVIPTRRTANVVAITDVRAMIIPYNDLTDLLKQKPSLATKVFAAINCSLAKKYLEML